VPVIKAAVDEIVIRHPEVAAKRPSKDERAEMLGTVAL
jgi:hypothetical protein